MTRAALIIIAGAAALAAAQPAAAVTATAGAQATIVDPANIRVLWALAPPTVRRTDTGADFVGNAPSLAVGLSLPRNAQLQLRLDAPGGLLTAPTGFQVTRSQDGEALTLRMGLDTEFSMAEEGAIAGGSLNGGSAASIEVAQGLILVSSGGPSLPTPEAALVVVVQYN